MSLTASNDRGHQLPAASMVALAIDRPKIAIAVVFSMERLGVSINIAPHIRTHGNGVTDPRHLTTIT
jgi:hypothetical protein